MTMPTQNLSNLLLLLMFNVGFFIISWGQISLVDEKLDPVDSTVRYKMRWSV